MKIENLKELQKLILACRKLGVEQITIDGIDLKLDLSHSNEKRSKRYSGKQEVTPVFPPNGIDENTQIPTDELTQEQLLMWSVGGTTDPNELPDLPS